MRALSSRLLLSLAAVAIITGPSPAHGQGIVCNVRDHGAVGDGKTFDTASVQKCVGLVAGAAGEGRGVVLIPPGKYLLAPFNLTSHAVLRVEAGATLIATDDEEHWPVVEKLPSYPRPVENDDGMHGRYVAFIGCFKCDNVTIDGGGEIDGQGFQWWLRSGRLPGHKKTLKHTRGRLIEPMFSSSVVIRDITLRNSPFWTVHPYACSGVLVENVVIGAPVWSRNTDGIDPDSSTNVIIRNCTLSGGDDNVAIKSGKDEAGRAFGRPSANILVEDCKVLHGDGIQHWLRDERRGAQCHCSKGQLRPCAASIANQDRIWSRRHREQCHF